MSTTRLILITGAPLKRHYLEPREGPLAIDLPLEVLVALPPLPWLRTITDSNPRIVRSLHGERHPCVCFLEKWIRFLQKNTLGIYFQNLAAQLRNNMPQRAMGPHHSSQGFLLDGMDYVGV